MKTTKFHKEFTLNGISFSSETEILDFTSTFSDEIHQFLKEWFSESDVIIVQTSGSTGSPKSIALKKEYVVNSAEATGNYFNLSAKTSALLCMPTHYIAGKLMLVRALTLGWHLDVVEATAAPLKTTAKEYDFCAMVPLQLENSLSKIHLIKKLIVGGGVVSKTLETKIQAISTDVFATYGMTETITHIAVKKLNNFKPLRDIIIHKSSKKDEISSLKNARKDNFYEILANVTIYKDERNCLVIDAPKVSDSIIFTNDVVALISDKQFNWLGRFDNVINSGGIKLHPEKIEEKLSEIISNRFFVAGVFDEKLGEKLILLVEKHPHQKEEKMVLKDEIGNLKTLSKFEKPKEIFFIDTFIETATGKIQRKKTLALLE